MRKWVEYDKGEHVPGEPFVGSVRDRWQGVCQWGTFEVCIMHHHICLSCWTARFGRFLWAAYTKLSKAFRLIDNVSRSEAMKFIKNAVQATKKAGVGDMARDPELHEHRPALEEFMTCCGNAKDGFREVSPLMVVCCEEGVRVGLKDEDAGGWCWRTGKDFVEALNAVEKALQAGEGAFRAQKRNSKGKR